MATTSHRADRLADQIRGDVADLISRHLRDPRIGFTTVTRVELSADLQFARIFVSVLGDEDVKQQTLEGLARATGYVRHEMGHRLRLRRVPELVFVLDRGPEEALRLGRLIDELHEEKQ
jgi:ribosome-binding factor A